MCGQVPSFAYQSEVLSMYFARFSQRFAVLLIALGAACNAAVAVDITGAGATFPYPIYAKWADAYKQKTGVGLNYQSIGSGGGIKQIVSKTVDFGASDAPLKLEQLEKDGLVQFPTVMGGVVPVVNIDGVAPGQIKLTAKLLAKIYLGRISKWNDPQIASGNGSLKLPDPERVYSRAQLLDEVWGDHVFVEERTVDVHIRRLRQALEPTGHDSLVETVRGTGYRFRRVPA